MFLPFLVVFYFLIYLMRVIVQLPFHNCECSIYLLGFSTTSFQIELELLRLLTKKLHGRVTAINFSVPFAC